MPQNNLGRVAFKFKGDYSPGTTYTKYDVVFDGESSYVSLVDANTGNLLTDATKWEYLAKGNALLSEQNALDIAQTRADLNIFNYMYPSVQSAKRITTDLGIVKSRSNFNDLTNKFVDLLDSTKFIYCPQLAVKLRTSGITNYITKLYDIGSAMVDATQATALSQPFLTGDIAPNEKYAVKNPNGSSTYLTHTTISFLNTDRWTVSTMLTDFCHAIDTSGCYAGNGGVNSNIYLRSGGANRVKFLSNAAVEYLFNINNSMVGKNSMITLVANGLGGLSLYINGKLFQSISSTDTSAVFSQFINGATVGVSLFAGLISYHAVRNIALLPTQIDEEYQYIRSLYPEIRSVKNGTQEWSVVNAELTCTPQGNMMQEVKVNADWANSTTIYNNVYAATAGTSEQKEYAACKAAAMWSYYNNDPALGSIYGKLYNWYAVKLLQMDIDYYNAANPTATWGWRVPTSADFTILQAYLGGESVAGGKVKKEGFNYWSSPNTGSDNSAMLTLLGGGVRRTSDGVFIELNYTTELYCSNKYGVNFAYNASHMLISDKSSLLRGGRYLRLVKV